MRSTTSGLTVAICEKFDILQLLLPFTNSNNHNFATIQIKNNTIVQDFITVVANNTYDLKLVLLMSFHYIYSIDGNVSQLNVNKSNQNIFLVICE